MAFALGFLEELPFLAADASALLTAFTAGLATAAAAFLLLHRWMPLVPGSRFAVRNSQPMHDVEYLVTCAACLRINRGPNAWERLDLYMHRRFGVLVSHSLCPACKGEVIDIYAGGEQ